MKNYKLKISAPLAALALGSLPLTAAPGNAPLGTNTNPPSSEAPVPLHQAPPLPPAPGGSISYQQQPYTAPATIIAPEKARQVIDTFRAANTKLGNPRYVITVNRDLVDTTSGLQVAGHSEKSATTAAQTKSTYAAPATGTAAQNQLNLNVNSTTGTSAQPLHPIANGPGEASSSATQSSADTTYTRSAPSAATIADRQTTREVERLFGRPFRLAGAQIADQKTAASLLADNPSPTAIGEPARKDRAVLGQIADISIEILITSRPVTLPSVSGNDQIVSAPDIQATAIRLKDSAILGQASASDILGKDRNSGPLLRNYDARDIAEATALALMEDLSTAQNLTAATP